MLSYITDKAVPQAVIYGLSGPVLTADERAFFKESDPFGFILFARNCENPDQLKALTASLQDVLGRAVPILIDQEGGRIQRLRAPLWRDYPAAQTFGDLYREDPDAALAALRENFSALAAELMAHGVNVDCAPVLDVLFPETHDIIGDRAFSDDPAIVAALGSALCEEFFAQGVVPIIKHLPGHGRAAADSHKELPVVSASWDALDATDFEAFRAVAAQPFGDALWGMTALVLYNAINETVPVSCDAEALERVIRGAIGFDGLLMSDDLEMQALAAYGDAGQRARVVLEAGCDIALHCNGKFDEMKQVVAQAKEMTKAAVMRYNRSVSLIEQQSGLKFKRA